MTGGEFPINQFTHVMATWDGVVAKLYTNGVLSAQGSLASPFSQPTCPFFIGGVNYSSSGCGPWDDGYFNGVIDEVAYFSRALSSNEVAAIYAAGSGGMCYTNAPAPVFAVQPTSQTNLVLGSATFTAAAMGVPRPQYQWLFNGALLANATIATLVLNNLSTNQTGDYALVASNVFGSTTSSVAHLSVTLPLFLTGVEGFESGWDGWYPESGVWEVGIPTSGPGSGHSGSNVLATVLGGNYPRYADSRAISPVFMVPSLDQNPRLRF